jgi:2,4-dienoyl-CoA reductase-like NADH-dependent reductase (Old Yellow Enzyme family)
MKISNFTNERLLMMKRDSYKIFSEGEISTLKLKNRLVRSATYEAAMTEDGRITDIMLGLYKNLAEGGVGLIITGHMAVMSDGKAVPRQTCIYHDDFIKEIEPVADIVHKYGNGCKIIAQLSHAGRQVTAENKNAKAVGPSAVPCPVLKKKARALSLIEIQEVITSFVEAIVRVQTAGFDGAQIHAAHGWLLSSFLSPYTNHRDDAYGGSVKKRTQIIHEIVQLARKKVGAFPILIKINCEDHVVGGISYDSFHEIAREIAKTGVDAIEISGGMWDCLQRNQKELGFLPVPIPEARTRINNPDKQSYFLNYAKKLDISIPVLLVGGNRNIETMEKILIDGDVSFISMSRPLINEPNLPNRWLEGKGAETARCVSCNSCLLMTMNYSLKCLLNQNRMMQKVVSNLTPLTWKLLFN